MQPENQAPKEPFSQQPLSPTPAQQPLAIAVTAQHERKSLAIAIIVGLIFLLAAASIAAWLLTKPQTVVGDINAAADDVKDVKNITWIGPPDLPTTYTLRDQNSDSIKTTLFVDEAAGCTILLNAIQLNDTNGKSPKEATEKAIPRTENAGTKVTKNSPGDATVIKDHESSKEYQFETISLEQELNVPGIDIKKQFTTISYKQFGTKVAVIGYSCKESAWEAKKGEMRELIGKFTLKTER